MSLLLDPEHGSNWAISTGSGDDDHLWVLGTLLRSVLQAQLVGDAAVCGELIGARSWKAVIVSRRYAWNGRVISLIVGCWLDFFEIVGIIAVGRWVVLIVQ